MDAMYDNDNQNVVLRRQLRLAMFVNNAVVGIGCFMALTGFAIIADPKNFVKARNVNVLSMLSGALLCQGLLFVGSGVLSTVLSQAGWYALNADVERDPRLV